MTVPTIALCASPPSSVCSPPHQFGSHASYDLDLNSRSSSTTTASSSSRKPILGGLSCLFSSPSSKQHSSSSFSCDDRGEDLKELCSSFSSRFVSSLKKDYSSPISVFQGPFSCSTSHRSGDMSFSGSCRGGSGALFNGFMRSALNTCADFDSSGYDLRVGAVEVVELTFDLEDSEVEEELEPRAKELLLDAQSRHRIFYDELVVKAFHEAEKAHRGQTRASGGPYLQHCVETAVLLAQIGANATLVAAGLLHDTIDDSFVSYDSICRIFGASVADLVEGVSKLSHLSKLARDNNTASKTAEADRLHTMFLGMADARAVLVKLADRLHNMMTLDALPAPKQRRFAKETLEIFVPLANRLGISSWKEQLEDLCFKHLNPDQYKELSSRVLESFDEAFITSAIKKLEQALEDKVISKCRLSGRHKSLYSIHSKMLKKGLRMDEIHDIHGLRLIVENKEDCYKALEVVHQLWSQVPGKFKDYVSHPKINGYQSLHTVVMGEGMVPLEVQIRTKEMHLQAEFGIAAHWRYKEGDAEHPSFILQMVEWARWVITWQCETMNRDHTAVDYSGSDSIKPPCRFPSHSDSCLYSYKAHLDQTGPVIVIVIENDKMSVQELPANSTVMDLLEKVGQGNHLRSATYGFPMKEQLRPRLNRRAIGDPSCILRMGDLVELTPALPDKALTEYREEIQRMFDRGPRTGQAQTAANSAISLRS